eukprot:334250_1
MFSKENIMAKKMNSVSMLQARAVNIQKLSTQNKFNDVTFIIGENKIEHNANRLLFAAISPVFEAMFYGQMLESQNDCDVIFEDVDEAAFEQVIKYAFFHQPQITEQNVLNIKHICRKYQIETLAVVCDKYFRSCLNVDNFCTLLNAAIQLKFDEFIKSCSEFYVTVRNKTSAFLYDFSGRNMHMHFTGFSPSGLDMHFIVGKQKVPYNAHSFLVCQISPVFREIIQANNLEISIESDVDAVAFGNVLEYSYCRHPNI